VEALTLSARQQALELNLVGLALSGGGIRSATFNLGVLQGLAHLGVLRRFDYLSTVSGGGYIGTWLAAWIKREGNPFAVEQQLKPSRGKEALAPRLLQRGLIVEEEPEPVHHLRSYSNYLSPRLGLFSIDTWTLISIYLRNFLLNIAVLIPCLLGLILASRLVLWCFVASSAAVGVTFSVSVLAGLLVLLGFAALTADLRHRLQQAQQPPAPEGPAEDFVVRALRWLLTSSLGHALFWGAVTPREQNVRLMHVLVFWPLLLAGLLLSWLFRADFLDNLPDGLGQTARENRALFAVFFGVPCGMVLFVVRFFSGIRVIRQAMAHTRPNPRQHQGEWTVAFYSFLSGWLGGFLFFLALLVWLWEGTASPDQPPQPAVIVTIVPPFVLLLFLVGIISEVGLHGRILEDDAREWWGTVGAYLLVYAFAWLGFFGITLYGGWLVDILHRQAHQTLTGLTATWIVTALGGVLSGRSALTRNGQGNRWVEWIGVVAPPVFVVGLLIAISLLANALIEAPGTSYWQRVMDAEWGRVLLWGGVSGFFAWLLSRHVDVNRFSLHGTYANRLIRCYLGASRRKRQWGRRDAEELGLPVDLPPGCQTRAAGEKATLARPIHRWFPGRGGAPTGNEELRRIEPPEPPQFVVRERQIDLITGFDPDDDLLLSDLVPGKEHPTGERTYWGPFLVVNTALNLVGGDELAWQERKADSFVLTPLAGGSKSTGYRPLPAYQRGDPAHQIPLSGSDLTIGRAMAISGAAASPNMGYHSSPPLAFLMTVFNARLGWWMQNPAWPDWTAAGPDRWGLVLHELLGQTNEKGKYVYLSDGGHFENLGVYELVRRRCRFIVACDAGADPDYEFFDLGDLVRKCRNDFGIRIDLDVSPIRPQEPGPRSRWHCAVGTVRYDDVDPDAVPGLLVYLKTSLTGDEPSDVLAYADQYASFPHQTTVDQFFTESQFESYRALGFHVAQEVFSEAVKEPQIKEDRPGSPRGDEGSDKRLFARLRRRWFPPPPDLEKNFLESTRAFMEVEQELRRDPSLRSFSRDLFPELSNGQPETITQGAAPMPKPDTSIPELHMVCHMLQVMENAWLGLSLGKYHEHPLNRGWMNVFRRWTDSDAFSRYWPALRGQYGQEFVQFCEKELKLLLWGIYVRRYASGMEGRPNVHALRQLATEFAFEWFGERQSGRGLHALWRKAKALAVELNTFSGSGLKPLAPLIWVIWVENASKGDRGTATDGCTPFPCGVILVFRRTTETQPAGSVDEFEFFVWIEGPYRNQGIGRDCVSGALETVWRELGQALQRPFTLHVRYPAESRAEGDEPLERALWSSFFHYYDFHGTRAELDSATSDLLLACSWRQYIRRKQAQLPRGCHH
jgi:predicted acylesterase/phospholipase RssA